MDSVTEAIRRQEAAIRSDGVNMSEPKNLPQGWEYQPHTNTVICGGCAFRYGAEHSDDDDNWTCPNCGDGNGKDAGEIERLRNQLVSAKKALEHINGAAVCNVLADPDELFQLLQHCAEISDKALSDQNSAVESLANSQGGTGSTPVGRALTDEIRGPLADTKIASAELPKFEHPWYTARRIVCEEWQRAVKEFGLTPGSVTETTVLRIVDRLDTVPMPTELSSAYQSTKGE